MQKKDSLRRKLGLFLSFEGISETIYDSQVALHVAQMRAHHNVDFYILTYETWPGNFKRSMIRKLEVEKLASVKISLYRGVFIYFPFSAFFNAVFFLFRFMILKIKPDFIHARTEYSVVVASLTSFVFGTEIIWDCRGNSVAEFEEAWKNSSFLRKFFLFHYRFSVRSHVFLAKKISRKAIFVSISLKKLLVGDLYLKPSAIIPTTASHQHFYFCESTRREFRDRLGIDSRTLVFLYSGGIVGYQGFRRYVEFFKEVKLTVDDALFLIVTPHTSKAKEFLLELDDNVYLVLSSSYEEMNGIYNASDYGLLIREKNMINSVASPTKFSEYCLSGLPIVMNDSVHQSTIYAKKIESYINIDNVSCQTKWHILSQIERSSISERAKELFSREKFFLDYLNLYIN
jgi:glycosyltransferase involved in cell wall biosynthesis